MMNQRVALEVITPVYIGNTGNEYSRAEFGVVAFKKINKIIRFNLDNVAQLILNKDEKLFKEFLDIISNTDNFRNNRHAKNDKIKYSGLHKFLRDKIKPKDADLYKKILNSYSYKCTIKYGDCIADTNAIALIKEHLKTNKGLYISGSSIKGAVRNSLLYSRLNLNCGNHQIRDAINNENAKLKYAMKFFNFTDTFNTVNEPSIYGVESIGTKRNTLSFLETIDEGSVFEFEYYNSFNEKIHRREDLNNLPMGIDSIFRKIHDFSNDLIEEELRFIQKTVPNSDFYDFDYGGLENFYLDLSSKNTEESPLLRLGHGSGALTVSQLLNIKNSRRTQRQFTDFRNRNRIGKYYDYDFPKTRKLIVKSYKPLGWVKLSKID